MKIFAYHGLNVEEKQNGQDFIIDILIKADIKKACQSDDINDTLNYAKVKKEVEKIVTTTCFDLIEALSEEIAKNLILEFDRIKSLCVTVKKPNAPMSGEFDYVAVKIKRERKDYCA